MSDRVPDRIAVAYTLTARDYVAYAAAIDRRSRSWAGFIISVAVLFSAIPVALLFRTLTAQRTHDAELIEWVGRSSLFALALAILTSWIGAAISTQLVRRKYYNRWAGQPDSRTVVLETSGPDQQNVTFEFAMERGHENIRHASPLADLDRAGSGDRDSLPLFGDDRARDAAQAFVARGWRKCRRGRDRAPQPIHRQAERTDRAFRHGAPRIWTRHHTIDYERKMTLRSEPSSFHWIASGRVDPYLTLDPLRLK